MGVGGDDARQGVACRDSDLGEVLVVLGPDGVALVGTGEVYRCDLAVLIA